MDWGGICRRFAGEIANGLVGVGMDWDGIYRRFAGMREGNQENEERING